MHFLLYHFLYWVISWSKKKVILKNFQTDELRHSASFHKTVISGPILQILFVI